MAQNLVVVESPAKAKTIGKYLGRDYQVVASMGHVRDLPKSDFAVEINGGVAVTYEVTPKGKKVVSEIRIVHPEVLVGLLIGGSVAFMFSAQAIRAVGRAAARVVFEVRKQFREHPGIMDFSERPDYGAVVDICTRDSLRELLTPGLLAVLTPIATGFLFETEALGAYLAGAILTGQLLAVMLANAGGAWDNAKKYVEDGHHGGKNSEPHKATVIGDTVGDPFKDTAGPALNPLIKVMNLVAVLIAPTVVAVAAKPAILRVAIAVVAVAILAWALWRSARSGGVRLTEPAGEPAAGEAPLPVTPDTGQRSAS